jgi:hypothetical protein
MTRFKGLFHIHQPKSIHHRILLWMLLMATIPLISSNLLGLKASISLAKAQSLQRMGMLVNQKSDQIEFIIDNTIETLAMLSENQLMIDTLNYVINPQVSSNQSIINYAKQHLQSVKKYHSPI